MKVLCVLGTRPEAIKLAPVIRALGPEGVTCITSQHNGLLTPFLELFGIKPSYDLQVMNDDQDLFHVTTAVLAGLRDVLQRERPDWVVVQGDTTTAFAGALAASYERIPVAHVEAGLRTGDRRLPWPEELNRVLTDRMADLLFAPTNSAAENLEREGLPTDRIRVTGNTVVDALLSALESPEYISRSIPVDLPADADVILLTAHRRENFGKPIARVCGAVREIIDVCPRAVVVWPVHPNPNVRSAVERELTASERIRLVEPQDYLSFLKLMARSRLILTDSGGIQEEAPTLRKPVLVLRDVTERQESIEAGTAILVGTDPKRILSETVRLLEGDPSNGAQNPFGDGRAAERIVDLLHGREPAPFIGVSLSPAP